MGTEKVHSFVGKFLSLRATGEEATLTLYTKDGMAKVNIELDLGTLHNDNKLKTNCFPQHPTTFTGCGTSRQRRRERRIQERHHNENLMKMSTVKVDEISESNEEQNTEVLDKCDVESFTEEVHVENSLNNVMEEISASNFSNNENEDEVIDQAVNIDVVEKVDIDVAPCTKEQMEVDKIVQEQEALNDVGVSIDIKSD